MCPFEQFLPSPLVFDAEESSLAETMENASSKPIFRPVKTNGFL